MPWDRPTLKQLFERISGDFSGRLLDGGAPLPRSVIAVLSKVWAGACHHMHGMLAWLFQQVFVDTAESVYLERWSRIWGIFRKSASLAAGMVTFSGADGAVIPSGTILLHQATENRYATDSDGEIAAGTVNLAVTALEAGAAGNLPANAPLSLIAPIVGIVSSGAAGADGLTGGADEETDESLRDRFLARLRNPPRGGSKSDYEAWALEVPGVTRAWCYPLGLGIGTVSLAFVTDNAPEGPIPSPEMVARVQAHIDPLRPASVKEWLAFAPESLPIVIRLSVTPDTDAVRAAVRAELADLITREGLPDTVLYRSHIDEAISLAPGEVDHTLFEPAGNIEVPGGYLPVLHEVIFTDTDNETQL
ncbi:MAG: baseplate J/gp47 family protein [Deltaproteobacteria bacterium]|jgi:uncharacterized phage protein gp47/JayE|nr:baseplate J/gp47 family protein [Deltaproteobacteria bacterium]